MTRASRTRAGIAARPCAVPTSRERATGAAGAAGVDRWRLRSGEPRDGPAQRGHAGDRGAGRADRERAGQPEQLDEDEAGRERPDDGADRVRRSTAGRRHGSARSTARGGGSGSGTSRPSGSSPAPAPAPRAPAGRARGARRALERRVDPAIHLVDEPERDRRHQDDDDQDELEDAVHPQRRADPVGDPAADRRPDGHARRRSRSGSPTRPGSCSRTPGPAGATRRSRR